ncbi:MAG: hypothetical protein NTV58_02025 [Deltaproteobacteria bacterium]|nr:hypothetical protein [Deltaproteobacteria bacterium]
MLDTRGHPLNPLVGRSGAEAGKRILDPRSANEKITGRRNAGQCGSNYWISFII